MTLISVEFLGKCSECGNKKIINPFLTFKTKGASEYCFQFAESEQTCPNCQNNFEIELKYK